MRLRTLMSTIPLVLGSKSKTYLPLTEREPDPNSDNSV